MAGETYIRNDETLGFNNDKMQFYCDDVLIMEVHRAGTAADNNTYIHSTTPGVFPVIHLTTNGNEAMRIGATAGVPGDDTYIKCNNTGVNEEIQFWCEGVHAIQLSTV